MKMWQKRGLWTLGSLLLLFFLLYLFRAQILRGVGNWLIVEDAPGKGELVFVLGGNSVDRGRKAAKLYRNGKVPKVVCLGANIPGALKAFGIDSTESDLTARIVKMHGVPEGRVRSLDEGTSTWEEGLACANYCEERGVDSAIVLSDKFHLRRVRYVFEPLFDDVPTELRFRGASSSIYEESEWWRSEQGMLMVNNEYMKLLYYRLAKDFPEKPKKDG
jgi:uncharacterized SAM-binding protein YcdF (DUF218 family)